MASASPAISLNAFFNPSSVGQRAAALSGLGGHSVLMADLGAGARVVDALIVKKAAAIKAPAELHN